MGQAGRRAGGFYLSYLPFPFPFICCESFALLACCLAALPVSLFLEHSICCCCYQSSDAASSSFHLFIRDDGAERSAEAEAAAAALH